MSKKKDKELQTTITKWGVEVNENGEYVNFHPSICVKKYLSKHPIVIKDRLNYYVYDKEMYCWQKINLEDIIKTYTTSLTKNILTSGELHLIMI